VHDADFKDVLQNCKEGRTWNKFVINDGFVFRANKKCIPNSSVRIFFVPGGTWVRFDGSLWSEEDGGCTCYPLI
jgi:hypothetical protein